MSGWFGFPRTRVIAIGLVGLLALGVVRGWPRDSEDGWEAYAHAISTAYTRKMAADAQALREARAALAKADGTVTQTVVRYKTLRDTLNVTDTVQVILFVERADSVVRACTELQTACERFRVRADSVIAGLTTENDALRAEVKALHPSRLATAWDRVKLPLAFVAGAYIGAKATR